MNQPFLFEGRKVVLVKEDKDSLFILALEDNAFMSNGHLSFMTAGRLYRFCRCCFEKHVEAKK